jgi:hypothetical protein
MKQILPFLAAFAVAPLSIAAEYSVFRVCEDKHVIKTSDGAEAGRVEYIVIEPSSRRIVSTMVTGGVVGSKLVAVPFETMQFGADHQVTLTEVTRERLVSAPIIERTEITRTSVIQPTVIERTYNHFGARLDTQTTRTQTNVGVGTAEGSTRTTTAGQQSTTTAGQAENTGQTDNQRPGAAAKRAQRQRDNQQPPAVGEKVDQAQPSDATAPTPNSQRPGGQNPNDTATPPTQKPDRAQDKAPENPQRATEKAQDQPGRAAEQTQDKANRSQEKTREKSERTLDKAQEKSGGTVDKTLEKSNRSSNQPGGNTPPQPEKRQSSEEGQRLF